MRGFEANRLVPPSSASIPSVFAPFPCNPVVAPAAAVVVVDALVDLCCTVGSVSV